jgi:hypothetical protein
MTVVLASAYAGRPSQGRVATAVVQARHRPPVLTCMPVSWCAGAGAGRVTVAATSWPAYERRCHMTSTPSTRWWNWGEADFADRILPAMHKAFGGHVKKPRQS